MSKPRKFQVVRVNPDEGFYGAQVGDIFISCRNSNGMPGLWARPSENPCITEDPWFDFKEVCILVWESDLQDDPNCEIKEIFE